MRLKTFCWLVPILSAFETPAFHFLTGTFVPRYEIRDPHLVEENVLQVLKERADFDNYKPRPFNMREFYDRTGHDIKDMLLSCFYRGSECSADNFDVVSQPAPLIKRPARGRLRPANMRVRVFAQQGQRLFGLIQRDCYDLSRAGAALVCLWESKRWIIAYREIHCG